MIDATLGRREEEKVYTRRKKKGKKGTIVLNSKSDRKRGYIVKLLNIH